MPELRSLVGRSFMIGLGGDMAKAEPMEVVLIAIETGGLWFEGIFREIVEKQFPGDQPPPVFVPFANIAYLIPLPAASSGGRLQ